MPYKDPEKQRTAQRKYAQKRTAYYRERSRQRRAELKQWYFDLKSTLACERCGEDHPATIDFHHPDPSTKELDISKAVSDLVAKENILEEIQRCMVLCANCHRKEHWVDTGT